MSDIYDTNEPIDLWPIALALIIMTFAGCECYQYKVSHDFKLEVIKNNKEKSE